ncbi:MAG: NAD+ synthase [Bacteroidetes bacterium]|nr:NAD+ synthase [Bacteroidota bacterium]
MEVTSNDSTINLEQDTVVVKKLLVDFIKDQIHNSGFKKAVIGLSGGIDSSVVTYLTSKAINTKNVCAVFMPYKTSNKKSFEDAKKVAQLLKINLEVIDISEMADALIKKNKITNNQRAGNIMARLRMIVLYDISNRENALVVGTSNKTEYLLGYSTIFGDSACAINPIGDLYKTQVWDLAKELKIPKEIILKKPTADLWPGQTDEGEMGFSYKLVDKLLYAMVDERRNIDELKKLGFKNSLIKKVNSLIKKNQFKRKMPVIAKVSNRTINVDFRYVRDWGI